MLTYDQIKELIQIVSERHLHELEIERSGFRLKISGANPAPQPAESRPSQPTHVAPVSGAAHEAPAAVESRIAPVAPVAAASDLHLIASPIVGTFYSSPNPTAEPFVRAGDRVRKGQVLCIIEAMKLMNEIESEYDGEIVQVFVENGQPVQYGERLFAVRAR